MADAPKDVNTGQTLIALSNVYAFTELATLVKDRSPGLPNFGVFSGFSGYGKTYAAAYVRNLMQGIYVEVGSSWTSKTLATNILYELGVANTRGTVATMVEQIVRLLGEDLERPLIIDEADKMVVKGYIEIVREIADKSQAPVLLIGEEALPQQLARIERVHNRVLRFVQAQPCDEQDTRALAQMILGDIAIEDALVLAVREKTQGRARRIVTNFANARDWAATNQPAGGLTLANYASQIVTGEAPAMRNGRL
jgi:DNA transposition AAA+ family ATPase